MIPCPSFSRAIVEVENAANLGLEINVHDGASDEDGRTEQNER